MQHPSVSYLGEVIRKGSRGVVRKLGGLTPCGEENSLTDPLMMRVSVREFSSP